MTRGRGGFGRDDSYSTYASPEPSWAEDYLAAVQKKSEHKDSVFSQIQQIIGGSKQKYSSVEEAVLDMQKRTGLLDMLQKRASDKMPETFKMIPQLKTFIDNYVESQPGTSVDAVVFNILKIPAFRNMLPSSMNMDDDVKEYINKRIMEENPNQGSIPGGSQFGKSEVNKDTLDTNSPLDILAPGR